MRLEEVEAHLSALDRGWGSEEEALAAVVRATLVVNSAINDAAEQGPTYLAADMSDRLETWLQRLLAIARKAADHVKAEGFSVSVSFPAGVSVTINFGVREEAGLGRLDL